MNFPSSSWGKFTLEDLIEVAPYARQILENRQRSFEYLKSKELNRKKIYKEVWEVLQMPVTNPKTGEQDYVDVSKVSQLILDPVTIYDLQNIDHKLKISFELEASGQDKVVLFATPGSSSDEKVNLTMSLSSFEEMIAECVYSEKDLRLEHIDEFKEHMDYLIADILHNKKKNKEFYVKRNIPYVFKKGIGLILDNKVQREIGTFENLTLTYDTSLFASFKLPFLQGRQVEDLKSESDNYTFVFYSLEDNCIFSFTPDNLKYTEKGTDIEFYSTVNASIEHDFTEEHVKYLMIKEAENNKMSEDVLESLDLNDPINKVQFEEFRETRLRILKDSQDKAKKEKIINQFTDIDLF